MDAIFRYFYHVSTGCRVEVCLLPSVSIPFTVFGKRDKIDIRRHTRGNGSIWYTMTMYPSMNGYTTETLFYFQATMTAARQLIEAIQQKPGERNGLEHDLGNSPLFEEIDKRRFDAKTI